MSPEPLPLETLLSLKTSEFMAYVQQHVGDEDEDNPAVWDTLLDSRLASATNEALKAINMDLESQLSMRRSLLEETRNERFGTTGGREKYREAEQEFNSWKRRLMGYKRIVRRRMYQAKEATQKAVMQASPHRASPKGKATNPNVTKIQHNIRSLFRVAHAIYLHRQSCLAADIIPEPHDLALWDLLDSCSSYSAEHGPQTLLEWVERNMARPDWHPPESRQQ